MLIHIPYSGKFSHGANFAVFVDRSAARRIRTTKFRYLSTAYYGLSVGVVLPEC